MSNESEIKEAEVVGAVPETAAPVQTVSQIIQGQVTITLRDDGALQVNGPQNVLLALSILKAGEVYLTMQMQDQMRRAANQRPPAIVAANTDMLNMMKKLQRPS